MTFHPDSDPLEPNEEAKQAVAIDLGQWLPVVLWPAADQDWFSVSLPVPGYLIAEFLDLPQKYERPTVRFVHADTGRAVAEQDDAVARLNAGPVLVRVEGGADTPLSCLFRLNFIPEFDELERTPPPRLRVDETYRIGFFPENDVDEWQLRLDKPGIVWLQVDNRTDLVRTEILAQGAKPRYAKGWFHAAPGAYTLKVRPAGLQAGPQARHLRVAVEPQFDEFEPNDTVDLAKPLPFDKPVPVTLYPAKDVDWFRIDLPQDGLLQVMVSNWAAFRDQRRDCRISTYLYAANGVTWVANCNQSAYEPQRTVHLKQGSYRLKVQAHNERFSQHPVTLRLGFLADGAVHGSPVSRGGLTVAFAGIGLSEHERQEFAVLTHAARTVFVDSKRTGSIETAVQQAAEKAVHQARQAAKDQPIDATPAASATQAAPQEGPAAVRHGETFAWKAFLALAGALALTWLLLRRWRRQAPREE